MNNAILSEDRRYRYRLRRQVGFGNSICLFIMVNPSKADEEVNDPTITRDMGFARDWKCGWLEVANLFAYRATNPKEMMQAIDPVGPDNNHHLLSAVKDADLTVIAWGNNGRHRHRADEVLQMLQRYELHHLGLTKAGYPRHPLYVPKNQGLVLWNNNEQ